jgi:hypothetical protein
MIKPSPYYPFPDNIRLERSVCCELIDYKKDISRYIVIRPIRYLTEKVLDRIEKGIYTLEEYYESEIELLCHIPDPNTFWLYKQESFEVARKFHCDLETFITNFKDSKKFVFDNYNTLMKFCKTTYGVSISDFQDYYWNTTNMPNINKLFY